MEYNAISHPIELTSQDSEIIKLMRKEHWMGPDSSKGNLVHKEGFFFFFEL
jgi:hypothetical protein